MRKSVARAGAWLGAIALLLGGISAGFGVEAVVSVEVGFVGGIIIIASSLLGAFRVVAGNSSLGNHSHNAKAPLHCGARSSAPHSQGFSVVQSNTANTRIVCGEIQESKGISESTASDSHSISEFASPVIASVAKQSIKGVDCHAGKPARNDDKAESTPHANLESKTDSEPTSAERHALSAEVKSESPTDSKHPKDSHTPQETQSSDDSTNAKAPPSFTSRFILGTRLSFSLLRIVAYALFILALILLLKYQLFSLAWFFGGLSVGVCALIILVARTLLTQARQTRANIAKK